MKPSYKYIEAQERSTENSSSIITIDFKDVVSWNEH